MIKRRTFTAGALGLAAAPGAAWAQKKPPRIAYVRQSTPETDAYRAAFLDGMTALGYVDGRNVVYEFRYAGDDPAALKTMMSDVVRSGVDLIVTNGTPAALSARDATRTIPIVLVAISDPVAVGVSDSMARPSANITGFTFLLDGGGIEAKRIQLLKEALPNLRRLALLNQPDNPATAIPTRAMETMARSLGVSTQVFDARRAGDFESVFAAIAESGAEAVALRDDAIFTSNRVVIMAEAARRRLPVVCGFREFAEAGCLLSYAGDLRDNARRAATYVDKILRGAKPGDLPFQQPVKFDLVINLKTAKTLGFEIPLLVLAQADEVIE